jgi:hypothetical protein
VAFMPLWFVQIPVAPTPNISTLGASAKMTSLDN